jgi:hypothetical protein
MDVRPGLSVARWRSRASTRIVTGLLTAGIALLQPSLAAASGQETGAQAPAAARNAQRPQPADSGGRAEAPAPMPPALPPALSVASTPDPGCPASETARTAGLLHGASALRGVWTPYGTPAQRARGGGRSQDEPKAHSRSYYLGLGVVGAVAAGIGGYWFATTAGKTPRETADAFKLTGGIFLTSFGGVGAIFAFWKAGKAR